jgi:hypothetical protein
LQRHLESPVSRSLAERFPARQALLRGFRGQAKKAKPLRDMNGVAHGRPPYDLNSMRRWPLAAKEVDSELLPSMRSFTNQGGKWDSYQVFAAGSMRGVTAKPEFQVQPSSLLGLCQINIEIDPLPLGERFEFLVSADVVEIRTDEYLGHVPIPEPKCLGRGAGLRF